MFNDYFKCEGQGGTQGGHNLPPPVPLTFLSLCLPTTATFKDRKPGFSVKAVG